MPGLMEIPWFGIVGRVAVAYVIYKLVKICSSFFSLYLLPRVGIRVDPKKYGSWAVVTGSTDGIGKCYAKELAKAGLNVVLISRNQDRLNETKREIESVYKVEAKTIQFDFSNVDGYDRIASELKDLDIGILVNNVGVSYKHPQYTGLVDVKEMEQLVVVNCISAVKMTRVVLSGMLERKRGAIVSVTSYVSAYPFPFLSVYSASKIFVDYFTTAMRQEYLQSGIEFQVLCPMYVSTKMSAMRPSIISPTSETYARSAVGTLGLAPYCNGYWFHELTRIVTCMMPSFLVDPLTRKSMLDVRKRALRRLEKKK